MKFVFSIATLLISGMANAATIGAISCYGEVDSGASSPTAELVLTSDTQRPKALSLQGKLNDYTFRVDVNRGNQHPSLTDVNAPLEIQIWGSSGFYVHTSGQMQPAGWDQQGVTDYALVLGSSDGQKAYNVSVICEYQTR